MTKYLINLDGYLRVSLSKALSTIDKIDDLSFFCVSKKDKYFLLKDFPKSKIYCWENFLEDNFNKEIEIGMLDKIEKELNITIMETCVSALNYSQFYNTTNMSQNNKNIIDIKRAYLNYLFYSEILGNVNPDIILHEHAGGTGSEILEKLSIKRNIRYYIFCTRFFESRFLLMNIRNHKFEQLEEFYKTCTPSIKELQAVKNTFTKIKNNISPAEIVHIKNIKKKKSNIFQNLFDKIKDFNTRSVEENYILSKYPPIKDYIFEKIKSKLREFYIEVFYSKTVSQIISNNPKKKIITYFLQSEPELIIYKLGGKFFSDQKTIIKNLALSLPHDYILLIKEHRSQSINSRFRNLQFFRDILDHTNVRLVKSTEDPINLINYSYCIANLSGTIGLEALIRNKAIILFGNIFYENFPNVFKIKNLDDLKNIIEKIKKGFKNGDEILKYMYSLRKTMFKGNVFDGSKLTKNNDEFLKVSLKKIFSIYQ